MPKENASIHLGKDVSKQATGGEGIYDLVNMYGGGKFITLMKEAESTGNYDDIDEAITQDLQPYLYYNNSVGNGEEISLREILEVRQGKPEEQEEKYTRVKKNYAFKVSPESSDIMDGEKRLLCHKYTNRGAVGETPLHVCMLNRTELHNKLAKRMLTIYPKLIYDFYVGREFYGENVIHLAIANDNHDMFDFFLDHFEHLRSTASEAEARYIKALFSQRACGRFFLPKDQVIGCQYSSTDDTVKLQPNTNYEGCAYFGEYPLFFAACLGRKEMLKRLLNSPDVNINEKDVNGCTLLHMLVIHKNPVQKELFDIILKKSPTLLHTQNNQGLTPLTLAAKLAHIEMYDHILKKERQVAWTYGDVSCAAYPLRYVDSISETDGHLDTNSAMYHIVYGKKFNHTRMMSSVVGHILDEKWRHFAKRRLWRRAFLFFIYFWMALLAFYLRPAQDPNKKIESGTNDTKHDPCYLNNVHSPRHETIIRWSLEGCVVAGSVIYLLFYAMEIYYQSIKKGIKTGIKTFGYSLWRCPPKLIFLASNIITLLIIPGRVTCAHEYDDVMSIFAVLSIAPYFLFFLSGWEIIGTFVIMIYKMIKQDLIKFLCIYLIFVIGFSQAMYLMFRDVSTRVFDNPFDAIIAMFVMSLGEFGDTYESFDKTEYPNVPKALFMIYMILVTLLMINLLIAMMGDTYTTVRDRWETGEWLKERGNIILLMEQTMTPKARKEAQLMYCSEIHFRQDEATKLQADDATENTQEQNLRRAYEYRWHHSDEEKELIRSESHSIR